MYCHCGTTNDFAQHKSREFIGCGINLWTKTYEEWIYYIGPSGKAVYMLLMGNYQKEIKAKNRGIRMEWFEAERKSG